MNRRLFHSLAMRLAASVLLPWLLAGCGGSPADSGEGGSGSGGGIGGSGLVSASDVVVGEVTGFGSVFVNNQRFDTSAAKITVNGEQSTESLLSIGMRVVAKVDAANGLAGAIDYLPTLIGPIEEVTQQSSTFTVLGQSIIFNSETVFEGMSAADLSIGFVIEASGARNAQNQVVATFIRAANNSLTYQLSGNVTAENAGGSQLQIGGLMVNIAGLDLGQLGSAGSLQGLDVNIVFPNDGILPGASVLNGSAISSAMRPTVAIGSQLKVAGLVKSFSLGTFVSVDGYSVVVDEDIDIRFANGDTATLTDINVNSRIEITAIATGIQILVADSVVIF